MVASFAFPPLAINRSCWSCANLLSISHDYISARRRIVKTIIDAAGVTFEQARMLSTSDIPRKCHILGPPPKNIILNISRELPYIEARDMNLDIRYLNVIN